MNKRERGKEERVSERKRKRERGRERERNISLHQERKRMTDIWPNVQKEMKRMYKKFGRFDNNWQYKPLRANINRRK